jgi:DNA-binding MarR family transcriptional regulator
VAAKKKSQTRQQAAGEGEPPADPTAAAPVPEELRRELEDLGLSPYETRLLLAMLQLGPATTLQLAQVSEVPRTSTYPVLNGLSERGLAHRLPGEGPAVWACVSREEILERLEAGEQERLRTQQQRIERVRSLLAEHLPDEEVAVQPPLRLLPTRSEQQQTYQRLAAHTQHEALVCRRLNGDGDGDSEGFDGVLSELAGRAETRVLFEADQRAGASPSIAAMHACEDAGGYARIADAVPVEFAVFDRQAVLLTLDRPADGTTPTMALLEHAGLAEALTDAFKYRWAGGAPCACDDH